jgi:hypothetical protein
MQGSATVLILDGAERPHMIGSFDVHDFVALQSLFCP